jgi:uncharacterized protein YjbI with pentapeptide repeats
MANQEHLDILKQGVEVWNQWRRKHLDVLPNLSEADLSESDLSGANLSSADLSGAKLSRANLSHANLLLTSLKDAQLENAQLDGAYVSSIDLDQTGLKAAFAQAATRPQVLLASLVGANLSGANLYGVNLSGANLSGADLSGANLGRANLSRANLSRANLSGAKLYGVDLSYANLSRAELDRADLSGANLSEANLRGAYLRETNLREANLNFADLCQANLLGAYLSWANLSDANLSGTTLFGAYLREANLTRANLSRANARRANFFWPDIRAATPQYRSSSLLRPYWEQLTVAPSGANLSKADLSGADLSGVDLSYANLSGANLRGTNLSWANLSGANLRRADLTGCFVYAISAWDVQLEETIQANLMITTPTGLKEPSIAVDNLEVAQFIYLLLNHQKIRQTIDTITSQVVLILGHFSPARKDVIDALSTELHSHKYSPVVFNFESAESNAFTATVRTLANMTRFVLLDLTDLDDALREIANDIVPRCIVPIQSLLLQSSYQPKDELFRELQRKYRWVLAPYRYKDPSDLHASFQEKILQPINEKIIELKQRKPLKMFIGYAPEDKNTLKILKTHLRPLERAGLVELWNAQDVALGEEPKKEIERQLSDACIILLLISPAFLASHDCYDIQMSMAIERHERGEASVIPILLRPCAWQSTPLKELQPLPKDGKPISKHNKDDVFFEVSEEIGEVIKILG